MFYILFFISTNHLSSTLSSLEFLGLGPVLNFYYCLISSSPLFVNFRSSLMLASFLICVIGIGDADGDDPNSPTRTPLRLSPINAPCLLSAPSSSSSSSCASPVQMMRSEGGWITGHTNSLNSKNKNMSNRYTTKKNINCIKSISNDSDNAGSGSTSCSIDDIVQDSLNQALACLNVITNSCDEQEDMAINKNRGGSGMVEDNDNEERNIILRAEGTKVACSMTSAEREARTHTRTDIQDGERECKEDIGNVALEMKQNQRMQSEGEKNEELEREKERERERSSEDCHTRGYLLRKAGKSHVRYRYKSSGQRWDNRG